MNDPTFPEEALGDRARAVMSSVKWDSICQTFRRSFRFPTKARHNWFPGHMNKGLQQMQRVLSKTDCVIEVHDARIPVSGRNLQFKQHVTSGVIPHMLVLNKADLVGEPEKQRIRDVIQRDEKLSTEVLFTNCKEGCKELKQVRRTA